LTVCQTLVGADTRGAFVQPALYEAFGLTVIEAMTCGLPCFATNRGGPAEIIKNGMSGYHIECAPHFSSGALLCACRLRILLFCDIVCGNGNNVWNHATLYNYASRPARRMLFYKL